jgi:vitamin B12/bleomycin/antimicrobial peptide transport system ATP-binding/permease protein
VQTIHFLRDVILLARPYWRSEERWSAFGLIGGLLAVKLTAVYAMIAQNHWYKSFYESFERREFAPFAGQVGLFLSIGSVCVVSLVISQWLSQLIKLRWRAWVVQHYLEIWLQNRAYYRSQLENRASNPDQRICEDLGAFVERTLDMGVSAVDVGVSLIAFTSILWGLSGTLNVQGVLVPGYMVVAVFSYTVLSCWITHALGRPLSSLYTTRSNMEGDFRYGLMRVRENAETIAFYNGERHEQTKLRSRLRQLRGNISETMRYERRLGWFMHSHGQFSIILPFLLAAPRFFSGDINLGEVMQVVAAFGATQACMNFFVASYGQIAFWRSEVDGLRPSATT